MIPLRLPLILTEMATAGVTTGVNRYVSQWMAALVAAGQPVVYLRFECNSSHCFVHHETENNLVRIICPLPDKMDTLVSHRQRFAAYLEVVYPHLRPYLQEGCILHLHTINLIDLAQRIRQDVPCYTMLHLHCIPWKNSYNSHPQCFLKLYSAWNDTGKCHAEAYYVINNEAEAYQQADHIVCVTQSGKQFLTHLGIDAQKISVVYNGLDDLASTTARDYQLHSPIRLLFVGSSHQSKGLRSVLSAVEVLQAYGHEVLLTVAGHLPKQQREALQQTFPTVHLDCRGNLDYDALCEVYAEADLGIIASVQEQCSCAAIEMMRSGLPIVSTAVDGLQEMFGHEQQALLVELSHDEMGMPEANVAQLVSHLTRLIHDATLRERLGTQARAHFLRMFSLQQMFDHTLSLYQQASLPCPK